MSFILSEHVKSRAFERGIAQEIIEEILRNPGQIVDDESGEADQKVYQSVIEFRGKGTYLVRVFVNAATDPNVVKSAYMTSKVHKYDEGKI